MLWVLLAGPLGAFLIADSCLHCVQASVLACQSTSSHSLLFYRALSLQVLEYIADNMPPESAVAFGLHPNAEIGFKLREAESFCGSLLSMQVGRSRGLVGDGSGRAGASVLPLALHSVTGPQESGSID